ncbi:hypothetical protein PHMEG_00023897 [Phytophthora megakarya]|uniref:Uncharacterized protein n=1 Tax=Phytophthora megakarya TaxID=4795 RepID=A0A225VFQ9_9STRA|nr:hypothetical protein PHMEG_00023897 [Phytophthora megakarya]
MERRGVTGKSTFGNVRSAIAYLFTLTETLRPHDFDSLMKRFKGLHHSVARAAQNMAQFMLKSTKKGIYSDTSSSRVLESHVLCQKY